MLGRKVFKISSMTGYICSFKLKERKREGRLSLKVITHIINSWDFRSFNIIPPSNEMDDLEILEVVPFSRKQLKSFCAYFPMKFSSDYIDSEYTSITINGVRYGVVVNYYDNLEIRNMYHRSREILSMKQCRKCRIGRWY